MDFLVTISTHTFSVQVEMLNDFAAQIDYI